MDLVPLLAFGIPILLTLIAMGFGVWLVMKPSREMAKLEQRAAAGDPQAQAELARLRDLQGAMQRAMNGEDDAERQRLIMTGRPARATIMDVRPTGIEIGAGPVPTRVVEVDLSIDEGSGARTITVREAVSEMYLGRLLKGSDVPVRIDPTNPNRAAVLWDTK